MPRSVQHFHVAELIERDAAPVVRRSRRLQAGFAFSAVLVAKHSELPLLVPSQPVRAKQAVAIVVSGRDWTPALDSGAYNPVNIGQPANSVRSRSTTHTFRLLRPTINPKDSIFYNTVVLVEVTAAIAENHLTRDEFGIIAREKCDQGREVPRLNPLL